MTKAQKQWLADHPRYSTVRDFSIVWFKGWTDQGYLFASGRFVVDDGKTLFANTSGAVRVGREYEIV